MPEKIGHGLSAALFNYVLVNFNSCNVKLANNGFTRCLYIASHNYVSFKEMCQASKAVFCHFA